LEKIAMDRRSFVAIASMGALISSSVSAATSTDDARAVSDLLAEYQASWNAGDAARMFRLATDDIHWVNIVGMHWQGKAQAELAHRIYLETMFRGVPLTLEEVESIVPLGADALIVVARWNMGAFTPPDGQPVPPSKDRMSLVLQRTSAGLRIAHGANVQINPAVQQFDPAKGQPPA
jgi:uncharacterized protein (TIGR02246 family)